MATSLDPKFPDLNADFWVPVYWLIFHYVYFPSLGVNNVDAQLRRSYLVIQNRICCSADSIACGMEKCEVDNK